MLHVLPPVQVPNIGADSHDDSLEIIVDVIGLLLLILIVMEEDEFERY